MREKGRVGTSRIGGTPRPSSHFGDEFPRVAAAKPQPPRISLGISRSRAMCCVSILTRKRRSTLFGLSRNDVGEMKRSNGAIRFTTLLIAKCEIVRRGIHSQPAHCPRSARTYGFGHEGPKALLTRQATTQCFRQDRPALAQVSDVYDVVVIDCPPQLSFLTLSALCAATAVLITVHPQMLDVCRCLNSSI